VAVLQPIATARSVAAASPHRLDKWNRTAIEAAKQSGQAWLPELREIRTLPELLDDKGRHGIALLAVSSGNAAGEEEISPHAASPALCPTGCIQPISITNLLGELLEADRVLALIGPEGGWTQKEIAQALAAGARPVSIGPSILRIETAAVAIAAVVHAILRP
jgi:16S rRNA (uracil1498-N3)-methyltransferase